MKSSLRTKLDQLAARLDELNGLLGSPDVTDNLDRYRALTKEHSDITPVVARFREFGLAEPTLRRRWSSRTTRRCATSRRRSVPAPKRASPTSSASCRRRCCPRTRTTTATSSSRSAPAPAATSRRSSRQPAAHVHPLRGTAPLADRGRVGIAERARRIQGGIVRIVGQGAYSKLNSNPAASRAAGPRDRSAGAHPHVGLHGRRPSRGRSDRRHHDQPRGPADRHVPRVGRGRPAREQDRLRRAHHAPADGPRRRMPGRPVAAPQPRVGDVGAGFPAARPRAAGAAEQGGGAPEVADRLGDRSERIRTYNSRRAA